MYNDELRFLIYMGLLKGQSEEDIMNNLKISNNDFALNIGFSSYDDYLSTVKSTLSYMTLPAYEQMILSFYQTDIYCNILLEDTLLTSRTLKETILRDTLDDSILKCLISEMLPEKRIGKILSIRDGILTITEDLENTYIDKAVQTFKNYAYAADILSFARYKRIKNYFNLSGGAIIDSKLINSTIKATAKSGYKISALPPLLGINIPDYITIYNTFKVIIEICPDSKNFLLLTHANEDSFIIKLPAFYLNSLENSHLLFANSKFNKKTSQLFVQSNTGYKNLLI